MKKRFPKKVHRSSQGKNSEAAFFSSDAERRGYLLCRDRVSTSGQPCSVSKRERRAGPSPCPSFCPHIKSRKENDAEEGARN